MGYVVVRKPEYVESDVAILYGREPKHWCAWYDKPEEIKLLRGKIPYMGIVRDPWQEIFDFDFPLPPELDLVYDRLLNFHGQVKLYDSKYGPLDSSTLPEIAFMVSEWKHVEWYLKYVDPKRSQHDVLCIGCDDLIDQGIVAWFYEPGPVIWLGYEPIGLGPTEYVSLLVRAFCKPQLFWHYIERLNEYGLFSNKQDALECLRYYNKLEEELILIDWNPPEDRVEYDEEELEKERQEYDEAGREFLRKLSLLARAEVVFRIGLVMR